MKKNNLEEIQKKLNIELASMFQYYGITNVKLTSLGNSIASGYSMARSTKPLLLRNEGIESIMRDNEIVLERYNFSRAQNNNDEHIFEWILSNIRESEINKMNRNDFSGGPTSMSTNGMTDELLQEFYPSEFSDRQDNGLQDIILSSDKELANIVIYNGCTGSFLDNVTRGGKLHEMLTYGIKRDTTSLEATLKLIQTSNRKDGTNTQVYLCGAPNFLGFNIVAVINERLKKIAKQYANVTYVPPVKSKFVYPKYNESGTQIDIHYDEEEYQQLNNNILGSIIENYQINQAMINVDRDLYILSSEVELDSHHLLKDKKQLSSKINKIIMKQKVDDDNTKAFYDRVEYYLLERAPYDFFYLGKKNIKSSLNKVMVKN